MKSFNRQKYVFVALLSVGFVFSSGCGDEETAEFLATVSSADSASKEAAESAAATEEEEADEEDLGLPEEGEEVKDWEGLEEGDSPMMAFASSTPSFPSLSSTGYAAGYCRSTANNTSVYMDTSLDPKKRGTSSPLKQYNATIYASDEVYFYSINTTWAYISYPVGSGRSYGYIRTSDCFSAYYGENFTSKAGVDVYRRPYGASYGKIYVGDSVKTVGTESGYYQVFYPAKSGNRAWKVGYVTTSAYNSMKGGSTTRYELLTQAQVFAAFGGTRRTVTVTDLNSGKTFNISWGSSSNYHTDWSPSTKADVDIIKSILPGGNWSWDPRPAVVTINNRRIACGIHFRPHGENFSPGNGLTSQSNTKPATGDWPIGGHMCMYYGDSAPNGTDWDKRMNAAAKTAATR